MTGISWGFVAAIIKELSSTRSRPGAPDEPVPVAA
jgi:hypothetical protein